MARKDINVGLTGNDGTGDSIRDAFSKVNSNFQELYSSQGLEAGLTLANLVDVVKPLKPTAVLTLDNLGENVLNKFLIADNSGISIDSESDPENIIFSLERIRISDDTDPTLSNVLNASSFRLTNVANPTEDQDATTRKWVYQNFLNRDNIDLLGSVPNPNGSTLRANFKISPTPDNGNPNAGNQFILVKGSDGVATKTDVFLKYQGTDPAHATRKDYVDTKLSLQGTDSRDPATGNINQGFGVMTGPLILNDHPAPYVGILKKPDSTGTLFAQQDYRAATKGYVDSKSYSSPNNMYVSTIGNDDMWDFENDRSNPVYGYPESEIGRSWSKAFKSVRQAARFAKKYIDRVSLSNTPLQVTPNLIQRWVPPGTTAISSPRTRVRVSIQDHGFYDGDYVVVSGAILGSLDTRALNGIHRVNRVDANIFELNLNEILNWGQPEVAPGTFITIALANKKDGPYSTISKVDFGFRGFFIPKPEITIMIESGVYFEEFPIIIPANVAIKGDEFRRTLIKPKEGPAPAVNQTIKFVRGERSLGADYYYNTHYYHQVCRVGPQSTNPKINVVDATRLQIVSAAYAPKPGMRFIVGASGGSPLVYRVGAASSISFIPQDDNAGIAAGTYIMDIVDDNGDPKPLQNNLAPGAAFEFFLDNDHCDMFLVNDAFQARNISFVGSKGFAMAFDPAGQILTRSPYAQVCSTFSATGGGGQLIDGYAGNQVCYVYDFTYTDIFSGAQGASGLKMTVRGLARKPEVPNTFFVEKKKYIIIDSTEPDALTGTATLTLSSTTPIEVDDTYLERGFFPNNTTILIQTAGNRSMLSNDFTMINDLGYGIYVDNNGVCEAVSQFTYYCRVGYLARAGGQVRSVTGSSCYGLIGLQSEGSDPNEAIQIGRLKTNPVNIVTPFIDDALADGNVGAVSFIVGGVDSKPLRNSTFKLNKHEIILTNVARARTLGGSLTTGPIVVTTAYKHPFVTGDEVAMTSIRGLQLPPLVPGGANRTTDIDGVTYTITVTSDTTFTLNTTESTDYVNDLGAYEFADLPARAIANFVTEAQDITYTVKGDPSTRNISAYARFDGNLDENTAGQNVLQVFALERPAQIGMKFALDVTTPVAVNDSTTVYTVTEIDQKLVRFRVSPRVVGGSNDNKLGTTTLYITDVTAGWDPRAGWSFQLLDTQIGPEMNYDRYTIINEPTYEVGDSRWVIEIDTPLSIPSMIDQTASLEWTRVDGVWDLTLSKDLEDDIPNNATPISFLFYNSYWSVSIDPALAVALPTTTDSYNKPQAKKFNLYQLKTISIAQIINRPPIVNSSAMRFATSNFDPSIYRILGKTSDGGITTDVYGLAEEAEPLVGYYNSTVAKLLANKEFIKQETIAYLAEIYPDFEYNTTTCARDVGYILDAVAYDLTYGGNVRSRAAGITYYQQGNPSAALVIGQQKIETIDAINFATTVAHTSVNDYSGNSTPQLALPYRGSNLNGVARILANKEFVKEDVIAYLFNTYGSGYIYNATTCRRDVGLILDAIAYDLEYGGNVKTLYAAYRYYIGTTSANVVLNDQLAETVAALKHAKNIVKLIVLNLEVSEQAGNIEPQDLTGTPGVAGVDNARVETLMTILTNMLEFGLDDVTHPVPSRDLGIRRSYQDPGSGSYVGQTINNLLIPEVDSAVRITALMNQITAIIEFGPTNRINLPPPAEQFPEHIIIDSQEIDALQQLVFPANASSLQYGAILTGVGIPGPINENDSTPPTIIRTVTKLYDANQNIIGYRIKISALITEIIPAGTEITVTGPGSDYLFDLNTALDARHFLGDNVGITTTFSTVRATGHDFLQVGSGGYDDSNYPNNVYGQPVNTPSSGAIVKEIGTGRVFHVSTDEQGNFRVGSYFNVNQGDGSVTIAAKIGLSAVSSLTFLTGETVRAFSADQKMDDNSDNIVPTQKAIKTYISNIIDGRFTVDNTETPQKGLLKLNGTSVMVGQLDMGLNPIENIVNSDEVSGSGGVNRKYVDNVFAGGTIDYDGNFGITTTGKRSEVLAFAMATDVTTTGGVAVNKGGIDLNSNKILRVKTPTISTDGASKGYVDQAIATGGVRTGWNGFTLNDITTRFTVTSVNLPNTGSGYTTPPAVVFYSTSGVNASARAILAAGSGGRAISSIVVDSGGYGYLAAPTVIIGGSVGNAIVNTPGSGYRATPTITFSAPQITGGVTATGYVIMQGTGINQSISSIVITNSGAGYTAAPNITQVHPGLAPAVAAFLTTSLQVGSGAVATAVVTALPKNIDLNGNKVTGSADPTSGTDLVNWQYFDTKNYIGQTNDVTITGVPSSGDFLVFSGVTPTGSQGAMVNASVSAQSDIDIIRTNNSLSFNYKAGSISNADVATGAGIVQTKLSLNRANTTEGTPAANDVGVAAFKASQFTSTDGWIQLKLATSKTEGVTLDRVQQITNFKILGRAVDGEGTEATGVIQELSSQVVKNLLNLDPSTISGSISDDTLGGLLVSGASSGLSNRSDGSASYGALLKRGGTLRGQVTMTSNGLPADDPVITPILAVGSADNEKLDIGTALLRFRKIFGKEHYGLNFYSSADTAVYGKTSAPATYAEGQPVFNGKATFAVKANQVLTGLSGTAVGSGDIQISNGANSVAFDGSQACTISILANSEVTNSSIVRRTTGGNIKATTFEGALSGNSTTASGILLSGTTYAPTTGATASTTALRDSAGDLYAVVFRGRATTANYADLAENYQADAEYAPGTVLEFGGEFEVTVAEDETRRVAGVVSTNPAYLMNTDLEGKNVVAIALQGRVPCKVRGKILKGDMLVSGGDGYARPTTDPKLGTIIGKALENFDGVEGVIEVAVGRL